MYFQDVILELQRFWAARGCVIWQPYDLEVGAGTFNPATFLRVLGPEPWRAAYVEPSRRPSDGRYGENPNRLQRYYQFQVIIKPAPADAQDLYLDSLRALGIDLVAHDLRFVEDDWEQPSIGAAGLGWEVWLDGMEVTQFTYFQKTAGMKLWPMALEITYGLERIAMFLQGVASVFDLQWTAGLTYGDVHRPDERQFSALNFTYADVEAYRQRFELADRQCRALLALDPPVRLPGCDYDMTALPLPAYDYVMKASHAFNMLHARGAVSVAQREQYLARVRDLARQVAEAYVAHREQLGFPLLARERAAAPG